MSIHIVPLLTNSIHSANANVYPAALSDFFGSTVFDRSVLTFIDGVTGTVEGSIRIPDYWVGSSKFIIDWTSDVQAGNVALQLTHRTVTYGTSRLDLDTSPDDIIQTVTTSGKPGVAGDGETDEITLTATDLGKNKEWQYKITRLGAAGGDTKVGDFLAIGAYFQFSDA